MTADKFLITVITCPDMAPGETDRLEGLLEEGLEKLHIRKPGGGAEVLLERLAPRWHARLVLHGGKEVMELAERYKVPQVHGHWYKPWLEDECLPGMRGISLSASLHSWEEVMDVPTGGLEYVFLSPLYDSISKPGYLAGDGLLRRPSGVAPCKLIGLGGISADNIGEVIAHGWDGAALLGYIWQQPEKAVEKFRALKNIIDQYGR